MAELGGGVGLHHWEVISDEREQQKAKDDLRNTAIECLAASLKSMLIGHQGERFTIWKRASENDPAKHRLQKVKRIVNFLDKAGVGSIGISAVKTVECYLLYVEA